MIFRVIFIVATVYLCSAGGERDHGYLETCKDAPVVISDSFLNKHIYYVIQAHFPNYMYRKRIYYGNVVNTIARDIDIKNRKVMVFMDGYMDTTNQIPVRVFQGSYAQKGYLTIAMDCQLLNSFIYPIASRTNRQIGNITATLLQSMMRHGLKAKNIELVGISMGGQTVSFVAKHFTRLTGQKVSKIVSLDPSGPCFRNNPPSDRLSPNDADFVQVVHTASDSFGMGTAQGHVDFYINGAEYQLFQYPDQPWCDDLMSHVSVNVYYLTAYVLYPDKFIGVKCKDVQQAREHRCYENVPVETNIKGPNVDPKKRGIYYLPVRAEAPFYAPEDFLKTKPVYPYMYFDAFSNVEYYVLNECFHCKHEAPI